MEHEGERPIGEIDVGLIFNRQAIRKHFGFLANGLGAWSTEHGLRYDAHVTDGARSLHSVVDEMLDRGASRIIAAGGDGTVARVASALLSRQIPLGILPLGTANGVARQLGIPLDLERALNLCAGGYRVRYLDGIKVDDRLFLISLSVGLSVKALDDLGQQGKQRFGVLAYYANALKKAFGLNPETLTLTLDHKELHGRFLEVAVLNMKITGLPEKLMGGEIQPDNGRLRALAVRGRQDGYSEQEELGEGEQETSWLHLSEVRTVRIQGSPSVSVQADGDVIGRLPVQAEIVPKAVQVIVPEGPE